METDQAFVHSYDAEIPHRHKHIDALSIGLFGLTVAAITLGLHQIGAFGGENEDLITRLGIAIMSFIFGGVVQVIAGFVEIKYDQQLGGTALTMYGFLWIGVASMGMLTTVEHAGPHPFVEIPLIATFAVFSAVMVYLTGMKNFVLMLMHICITVTLSLVVLAKFGLMSEVPAGIGHFCIAITAFVEAMGVLVNEFTGTAQVPLGGGPFAKYQSTTLEAAHPSDHATFETERGQQHA